VCFASIVCLVCSNFPNRFMVHYKLTLSISSRSLNSYFQGTIFVLKKVLLVVSTIVSYNYMCCPCTLYHFGFLRSLATYNYHTVEMPDFLPFVALIKLYTQALCDDVVDIVYTKTWKLFNEITPSPSYCLDPTGC
jgi:hypothetical protein